MQKLPVIAAKKPIAVNLERANKYYWCVCGRSASQPFCDGSHKATEITPLVFIAEESGKAFLCQCKGSANAPYCDGTHSKLGDLAAGDALPVSD